MGILILWHIIECIGTRGGSNELFHFRDSAFSLTDCAALKRPERMRAAGGSTSAAGKQENGDRSVNGGGEWHTRLLIGLNAVAVLRIAPDECAVLRKEAKGNCFVMTGQQYQNECGARMTVVGV